MFNLYRWKVQSKLILLTGILILGMVIYGILSSTTLRKLEINGPYYEQIKTSQELIADILPPPEYIIESYLLAFQEIEENNPEELQRLIARSNNLLTDYEERHVYWDSKLPEGEIHRVFINESYVPAHEFLSVWKNQFLPALKSGNKKAAEDILKGPMKELYGLHRTKIDEVVRLATEYNTTLEKTLQDLGNRLQFFSNLSWIITIFLGILLATVISYSITTRLREVLKKVVSASKEIGVAMTEQSHEISHQLDIVHESNKEMDGLNQSFKHTEALAVESRNRAKNSLKVSEDGNLLIKKMLEGLLEHKDKVLGIVQQILRLSEITNQIHNIASITSNLTNQTNMLALNAAVQAAQVKQHSEGFSVIASEIRKLADESKKFLSHIDVLAENIKQATDSTVGIAEEGNKTVQECIKLAQSTAESFDSVISITTASFEGAEQVLVNIKEQSTAVNQVVKALEGVSASTEVTQNGMEQVRSELTNLNDVSEELKTIV